MAPQMRIAPWKPGGEDELRFIELTNREMRFFIDGDEAR